MITKYEKFASMKVNTWRCEMFQYQEKCQQDAVSMYKSTKLKFSALKSFASAYVKNVLKLFYYFTNYHV